MIRSTLVILALTAWASSALAWQGRVIGVPDGDTIEVLDANHHPHRLRMDCIDAPEKAQAFGTRSKAALSIIVYGREVDVRVVDMDRYGRTVARVIRLDGLDANLEQVRTGHAWVYAKYCQDTAMLAAEQEARAQRLGLWSEPSPTPPWNWRKAKRGQ